jgi:hypothetical protein
MTDNLDPADPTPTADVTTLGHSERMTTKGYIETPEQVARYRLDWVYLRDTFRLVVDYQESSALFEGQNLEDAVSGIHDIRAKAVRANERADHDRNSNVDYADFVDRRAEFRDEVRLLLDAANVEAARLASFIHELNMTLESVQKDEDDVTNQDFRSCRREVVDDDAQG